MTQENLAAELGINNSTYLGYEKDASKIQLEVLDKISTFYGLTMEQLLAIDAEGDGVNEPKIDYKKGVLANTAKGKIISMVVELDGKSESLDEWVRILKTVNSLI